MIKSTKRMEEVGALVVGLRHQVLMGALQDRMYVGEVNSSHSILAPILDQEGRRGQECRLYWGLFVFVQKLTLLYQRVVRS